MDGRSESEPEPEPDAPSWTDLPDEVLLRIFSFLGARDLAAVEATARHHAAPAGAGVQVAADGDEGAPLSLAEAAARRVAQSSPQLRASARREGESWKRTLALLEAGLYAGGSVLRDLPVALAATWILVYDEPYDHRTSDADLERVPADARDVLVCARDGDSDTFALAAWAPRETALRETHGAEDAFGDGETAFTGLATVSENECDGVFWYRWTGSAFGFSGSPRLWLWKADAGIKQRDQDTHPEELSETRLSWNLEEHSTGGWRAGLAIDLGQRPGAWRKQLFYRMATAEIDALE